MDAKRPALGFSRPTDNFCSVAWRESTVWWMPAIVPTTRSKLAGKIPSRCATRARSSVEQCSTPRPWVAPVVAQLEELQRKLRSPAPPAALWVEGGSNRIENP